jgi:hypothetical protein
LIIFILTIGTIKKNKTCAYILLGSVIWWLCTAIYGLFFKNVVIDTYLQSAPFIFLVVNIVYFGIILVILFLMSTGIWGQPSQKYRKPALYSAIALFVISPILALVGSSVISTSGSISGHIFQPDGTIVNTEVQLICFAKDRIIAYGDPMTAFLPITTHGNYKISKLPGSDEYYLWVIDSTHNLYSDGFQHISVKPFQETSLDLILKPGGTISGRFLDSDGDIIPASGDNKSINMYSETVVWDYRIEVILTALILKPV